MMTAVGYRTSPRCPSPHSTASDAEHLGCSDFILTEATLEQRLS